ncbi:Glycosyltransferase [Sulfidibacter corallicola]|uniref:Glycosyltransferase n=1 Tax=Sulfidibacter corallicola TaxID=2818388 RepID=A0A8A4TIA1_SULCO|nr:glycosyltransferase family 2 protein [Sulfidibacter corallicola]QTD49353.1 glycosyltransferase [Sulfidibacter corallicola]
MPLDIVYSIIVVSCENLNLTVRCLESLRATLPFEGTEILMVDNGSHDGTRGYLKEMAERDTRIRVMPRVNNDGWCVAANQGLAAARGRYLVLLNNDVMVSEGWLGGLRACMDQAPDVVGSLGPVGLAGPLSNSVGGLQAVEGPNHPDAATLNAHAAEFRRQNERRWERAWFLSGFCLMFARACYEDIGGLDERFSPGGFDDNDLVLRAEEAGWSCVVAGDVYVHHEGGATFRRTHPEMRFGLRNRARFSEKWREARSGRRKLVAAYRIKDARDTIEESLNATARFADHIVVLDDGSTDGTGDMVRNHPAVTRYVFQDLPFDERRDRNKILEMAGELNPDWVISIDADEVFEMNRDRAQRLMHLNNPHIKVLGFHWYTFWEPEHTWFRADGIFGSMCGYRMYRWHPHQRIVDGTEEGLHCGNIPQFSEGARHYTDIRVRHLGYDREDLRRAKYDFYRRMDKNPRAELVGNTTYDHLISPTIMLRRYQKRHGLALCMITKNEDERLEAFLDEWQPFVDEICLVDTGSTDDTLEIARHFTDKIERFSMRGLQLDEARNRANAMADMPWILSMDPDETIDRGQLPLLHRLLDNPEPHAYSFEVANHQKDDPPVHTLAVRLFRNQPEIHYSRPVHETVEQSLYRIPDVQILPSGIQIQHFGFLKSDQQVQSKIEAYYQTNKQYRETFPEDPLPWFNEALHFLNEGDVRKAGAFFEQALALDPQFLSPYAQLAYIHQERALILWENLLKHAPPTHPIREQANQTLHGLMAMTPPRPVVGEARGRETTNQAQTGPIGRGASKPDPGEQSP